MECTLGGGYDDGDCITLRCAIFKARKDHQCEECGMNIKKGDNYEGFNGINDGYFYWVKTCTDCLSLRNSFYPSGGYLFGNIKDTISEHIMYELSGEVDSKCIIPLTSKARDFVFSAIEQAWEYDD